MKYTRALILAVHLKSDKVKCDFFLKYIFASIIKKKTAPQSPWGGLCNGLKNFTLIMLHNRDWSREIYKHMWFTALCELSQRYKKEVNTTVAFCVEDLPTSWHPLIFHNWKQLMFYTRYSQKDELWTNKSKHDKWIFWTDSTHCMLFIQMQQKTQIIHLSPINVG